MNIKKWFNYEDWVSYVNLIILVIVIVNLIGALDTLVRWKWGYWSIDFIPPLIIGGLWYLTLQQINISRLFKRVGRLEEDALESRGEGK